MTRSSYFLWRLIALLIIVAGAFGLNDHGWSYWWHLAIFVVGLEVLVDVVERYTKRRMMPYRWHCPICKNKGHKIGVESSVEDFVSIFRESHNRTVHLMEP